MRRAEQTRASHLIGVLLLASALLVLTALLPTAASAADVPIENAGFEQPAASPGRAGYFEEIPGWTRSQGERLELQNGVFGWTAAEGNQWIELDAFENNAIYQDVQTTPGHRYLLAFQYSPRPGVFARAPGLRADTNELRVFWDGKLVKTVARDGSGSQTTWQQVVLSVRATKASTQLEFRGAGKSDTYGAFLDDVQLSDEGLAPATGTNKTVRVPLPGKTRTVAQRINKKSKEITAIFSSEQIDEFGVTALAAAEKARRMKRSRLERLRKIQQKLETNCLTAVLVAHQEDAASGAAGGYGGFRTQIGVACNKLMQELERRIGRELERDIQAIAQAGHACVVFRFQLRAEKKAGKWVTRVVRKGVKPRLKVTCQTTDNGLQLTLRAKGKRTLRQAVGKKLKLTLRRSDSAPAPPPGARISVSFTQK